MRLNKYKDSNLLGWLLTQVGCYYVTDNPKWEQDFLKKK